MTILGMFVAIILNKDKNEYVNFHIRQSLGTHIIFLLAVVCILTSLILALIVYFLFIVLWVFGVIAAMQNSTKPIPLLGEKFQKLFSKIV
ncbi:MAG TPA: DUF4870 domain-containing protein [Flavobacteriaceae bacterium]|nr:DUF4870 domain-containing protein [Flavobacteriaceae bacterium]